MKNSLLLGLGSTLVIATATAAPVPKETIGQKFTEMFGTFVDPKKDCEYDFDGKKLTIKVGKGDHALQTVGNRTGAARTLRAVDGNFQVEVTATPGKMHEGAMPAQEGRNLRYYSQGLLLWIDNDNFIRFEHAHVHRLNDAKLTYASWELFEHGEYIRAGNLGDGHLDITKPTQLRLKRERDQVIASWSQDEGKTWRELDALEINPKAKVQVGVIVNHNTDSPYSASFEGFKITLLDNPK